MKRIYRIATSTLSGDHLSKEAYKTESAAYSALGPNYQFYNGTSPSRVVYQRITQDDFDVMEFAA